MSIETEADLEQLLADILDSDKPLPGPSAMAVAQGAELGGEMVLADIEESPVTQVCNNAFTDSNDPEPVMKLPVFTADDFAATMDIRNFATLVTLNTARWHAKVRDRKASKNAAIMSEAKEAAFETRKRLLVGVDEKLIAIHRAIDEARVAHYEMTLPWTTTSVNDKARRTGGRLLPNTLFFEYTKVMADHKQTMLQRLNEFVPAYPDLINAAKINLGKSFDPTEYPNPSSIHEHFSLSFDFQPIPQGEDFKGLPNVQLQALAAKVNDNARIMTENAMQELWIRLYKAVSHMAERLSSPDKTFHDTTSSNVKDITRLISHLNMTADARIEGIRKKVEKNLCVHDPKEIRKNPVLRTQVAAHARSIIEEMNQ